MPVSDVVQPSAYATVGLPPMTTAHSYSPLASAPTPSSQYGPAARLGRKHGATARRDVSLALVARAHSVMLFLLTFGPLTAFLLP